MAFNQTGKGAAPAAPYRPNQAPPQRGKNMAGQTPRPPYVHVEWPKWLYDPETGKGEIFDTEDDAPEGWFSNPQDCGQGAKAPKKKKSKAKSKAKPVAEKDEHIEPKTLDDLELTRQQAIDLLEGEDVQFKSNASNQALADLVSTLLDD